MKAVSQQKASSHTEVTAENHDDIIANVLRRLSLNDSIPEPGFNRFTRLVCRIADVRTAMVTFVDESTDRQFFKSARGLPPGVNQTSLDKSFCKIVARSGKMLAVSDARTDDRVKDNPAVKEMGVIAYLGAPISGPSGESLGSLCAVDRVPRDWSENERRAMTDLAACVTDQIALRQTRLI